MADKSHASHSHPKWLTQENKDKVVQYKLQHPHLSSRQIAKALAKEGILQISYHSVADILKERGLSTPLFIDKSSELKDKTQPEKVSYLLSLKEQETSVVAINEQYGIPRSNL